MNEKAIQEHRRARLKALLAHEDFDGNKAELGRALGYTSGAFVRQMVGEERPISEKTVLAIEEMRGGKFKGWFAEEPVPPQPDDGLLSVEPDDILQAVADLKDLPPAKRSRIIDMIHQEAEDARAAAEHLASRKSPAVALAAARRPKVQARTLLKVQYGDGNPRQGALPLTVVPDPFTAAPSDRELQFYDRIDREKQ